MTTKIYGIRHKETKEFERFNYKSCWMTPSAAKSGFVAASKVWNRDLGKMVTTKFDDQDIYELVELTEYVYRYEGLKQ